MIQKYRMEIIVDIDDLYGFQRKAKYIHLIDDFINRTTTVRVLISWFKNGIEIVDVKRNFKPYEKEIIADNNSLVNTTTGIPELSVSEFYSLFQVTHSIDESSDSNPVEGNITWKKDTPNYYMGESDFYCYVRDNMDVRLKTLIINAITRANARGIL